MSCKVSCTVSCGLVVQKRSFPSGESRVAELFPCSEEAAELRWKSPIQPTKKRGKRRENSSAEEEEPSRRVNKEKRRRWKRRQRKEALSSVREELKAEQVRERQKEIRQELSISTKMMEAYGFDPDPSFTARHNAMIQLGNLPLWSYRSKATNLAFHDLTKDRSLPPTTSCLLGLGSKFIPTPLKTTSKKDMEQNISRFYRDICLAAHFAHSWSDEDKPQKLPSKLRVASNWQPPAPNQELYSRTMSFMRAV